MRIKKILVILCAILFVCEPGRATVFGKENEKTLEDLKIYAGSNVLVPEAGASDEGKIKSPEAEKRYIETQKQAAYAQMELDRTKFGLMLIERETRREAMKNEFRIQTEYYNICADTTRLELARNELKLAEKQVSAQKEKFDRGYATQLDVNEAGNRKKQTENRIADLERSIAEGRNRLSVLLNEGREGEYDLTGLRYEIPVGINIKDTYTLEDLISSCEENNIELAKIRNEIRLHNLLISSLMSFAGEEDASYIIAVSDLEKLKEEATAISARIKAQAESQYNAFQKSLADCGVNRELKSGLNKRLELLEASYKADAITDLQYLSDKNSITEAINNINFGIAGLINAKASLELIAAGII